MLRNFKPSQVVLHGVPLVGTMGKAEAEMAAAMIVRCCALNGDEWRSVPPRECGEMMRDDIAAGVKPFATLWTNPFLRPDAWELVKRGFGAWDGEVGVKVTLTDAGLLAIERYVRAPS